LKVTVALLSEVEIAHVLVTVCDDADAPVPPHVAGALTVPVFGVIVTEPLPVPAKVNVQLRASVKIVCAWSPDTLPTAVR